MPSFADNSTKLIVLLEKYWFFCFKLKRNAYICLAIVKDKCENWVRLPLIN